MVAYYVVPMCTHHSFSTSINLEVQMMRPTTCIDSWPSNGGVWYTSWKFCYGVTGLTKANV